MKIILKTKWGRMDINPESVYQVDVQINPWNSVYRINFTFEGTYQVQQFDFQSSSELMDVLRKLEREFAFMRNYKRIDPQSGQLYVDERRRTAAINQRNKEEQDQ